MIPPSRTSWHPSRRRSRRMLAMLGLSTLLVAASCSSGTTSPGDVASAVIVTTTATVPGVGRLPDRVGEVAVPTRDPDKPIVLPAYEGTTIASEVEGNRLLMIGDSIFAGLSTRHGGEACGQLTELGWQVAVEAEAGRFADFGERVVASRRWDGWDAVAVFLGSNYDGNQSRYERSMRRILDGFAEVPVILVTTTPFRRMQDEVNEVIRALGEERSDVRVLEWASLSTMGGMLSGDGLHPSVDGQRVLVAALAQILGPVEGDGTCLASFFVDDSANPEGPRSGSSSSASTAVSSTSSATAGRGEDPDRGDDPVPGDVASEVPVRDGDDPDDGTGDPGTGDPEIGDPEIGDPEIGDGDDTVPDEADTDPDDPGTTEPSEVIQEGSDDTESIPTPSAASTTVAETSTSIAPETTTTVAAADTDVADGTS